MHRLDLTEEHAVPDPKSWSKAQHRVLTHITHVRALSAFGRSSGDIRLDCESVRYTAAQQLWGSILSCRSPDWRMIVCAWPTIERRSADMHPSPSPIAARKTSACTWKDRKEQFSNDQLHRPLHGPLGLLSSPYVLLRLEMIATILTEEIVTQKKAVERILL